MAEEKTQETIDKGTDLAEQAAEAATKKTSAPEETATAQEMKDEAQVVEIDGLDKVVFRGKEYTPEEFDRAMLRQADYTKKTQEIASLKKYWQNLKADLEQVAANPHLADRFKQVYPEQFHDFITFALNTGQYSGADDYADESNFDVKSLKREFEEMLQNKLKPFEEKIHNEKVEAAYSQLDTTLNKLGEKYDFAVEDAVLNKAQQLIEQNEGNPNFQMTDAAWERLYRMDHEQREKAYNEKHKKRLQKQAEKGNKAVDGGPGGQAVGRERKKMSFDEATEMAIQDLQRTMG